MKIKTENEFFDRIDKEISWRKTDLIRLRDLIFQNKNSIVSKTLLRSAIPIIYAHWEGFVKESSLFYVNYISTKRLKFKEHLSGILALYVKAQYLSKESHTDFEKALQICNFLQNDMDERGDIYSLPSPVKTKSNLNSDVLKEIMEVLNLDYSKFEGYEVLINSKLLEARNKIAHGEYREISMDFYTELHDVIFTLLELFKTELENAVIQKQYKKSLA